MYKNPKELLIAATALPAAIEEKLPAGAPKISVTLVDTAEKLPALPDFLIQLPDLPPVPAFPAPPAPPPELERFITGAEVTPVRPPAPARPGLVPFVYE